MKVIHVLLAMIITVAPGLASASHWIINSEQSVINFKVSSMKLMTVKGNFINVKGEVVYDESDISKSSVTAEVEAKTVNTGNNKRDEHLRAADFLDVATHNRMEFTSTRLAVNNGRLEIHGNLTIRGITKNVVLDAGFKDEIEKELKDKSHCIITATSEINRIDFGVDNNSFLTYGIGNNVQITLNIDLDESK